SSIDNVLELFFIQYNYILHYFYELKIWLQNYSKKFTEIKRGNGLRPQHIEQQYIAGAAGEVVRGKIGE
ncbi:MAG: hypothetical protein J6O49_06025, partial [Bacteroidaceae bacterium]|nr:hypothetical protein [Bacteroidaceae bacterium]